MEILERLGIYAKANNRYSYPVSPILFSFRFNAKLERLRRLTKGVSR
jgi:hypothetical protein